MNDQPNISLESFFQQMLKHDEITALSNKLFYFLYLLWNFFEISIVAATDESKKDEEGSQTASYYNRIVVNNGLDIVDYGDSLKTSIGKNYSGYSTQRLINTIKEMIAILAKRKVKQVKFKGTAMAERCAWIECQQYGIKTNYQPDAQAFATRIRVRQLDRYRNKVLTY